MASPLVRVGGPGVALLCELVDRLTATRNEEAVRTTIDTWRDRVYAAGLDPDALFEAFKQAPAAVHATCDAVPSWANVNKRELVLVCVALYARGQEW